MHLAFACRMSLASLVPQSMIKQPNSVVTQTSGSYLLRRGYRKCSTSSTLQDMLNSLISERWKDETLHHLGTYVFLRQSPPLPPPVLNIELRLRIEVIRAANDD